MERWRTLLACHTLSVYVFSLEQDTCVLIVVSQGTRNSLLLSFITRYYLNETVANDLRYSPGIRLDELTKNIRTANVFGHIPNPTTPQKAAGAVGEFIASAPFHLNVSQFRGVTSVSYWHCFLLRVRNIACCRKRYFIMQSHYFVSSSCVSRGQLKCDGTRAETIFRLSAKRTIPLKSVRGASVQSTTDSRGVCISGSNAGYTMFRGSVKGTCYPPHSPVSPSLPLPVSPCAIIFQLESAFPCTISLLHRISKF